MYVILLSPWGLSPRVRGNRQSLPPVRPARGSIPAGAGEPDPAVFFLDEDMVYPRGCGGTHQAQQQAPGSAGLSPRVRGNHQVLQAEVGPRRSIPAGAGEPCDGRLAHIPKGVYPRGCGGTRAGDRLISCIQGLSPRVRGNRNGTAGLGSPTRSIPAGAGEPTRSASSSRSTRVYPRGCGGTRLWGDGWPRIQGLSPRVRGNLVPHGDGHGLGVTPGVYPRGCGGTHLLGPLHPGGQGLSPRVRGNLDRLR